MTRHMLLAIVVLALVASSASAAIRIVRTGTTYATVQAASNACIDGDTIEIDSGTYSGTTACAYFYDNNLTIRGVGPTRPQLYAAGTSAESKGIFSVNGNTCTVEYLQFYDCSVASKNGAGIRLGGHGMTVRNCYFQNNEMGILTSNWGDDDVLLEYCEFNNNGYTGGGAVGHSIYIGVSNQLTIRYCWSHDTKSGHNLKTRAKTNYILYNRLTTQDGTTSYEIDIPIGGTSYVIGNLIHQGINASNATVISYAGEGATNPDQHLYVVNNTFVNNRPVGTFVNNYSTVDALVQNNVFQGPGTILTGPGTQTTNWQTTDAYLADAANYDYHLTASSTGAINAGTAPGTGINGFDMTPVSEYAHPCNYTSRPVVGTIDIGCYEYVTGGNQAPQVNAGNDQAITWPTNIVNLDGTVSDDGLPNPPASVTTIWSKVSGPGTVVFGNVYAVDTTATFGQTGTYVLQLLADDSALQTTDTVTITVNAAAVDTVASSETPVYGTVTGSYLDTQTSNNVYESIREVIRGSGSLNYSWLEHKWTFSVPANSSLTFYLEAYRPTNSDNDNFTFAYSTNGSTWTNMVTVSKAADDNLYQTYALPAGTSGTVYVRVVDTNRTRNKTSLDTIYVDHMFFRSQP